MGVRSTACTITAIADKIVCLLSSGQRLDRITDLYGRRVSAQIS